jgi:hypothetical protein
MVKWYHTALWPLSSEFNPLSGQYKYFYYLMFLLFNVFIMKKLMIFLSFHFIYLFSIKKNHSIKFFHLTKFKMFKLSIKKILSKKFLKGINFKLTPPIQSHENGKAKVVLVHEPGKPKLKTLIL